MSEGGLAQIRQHEAFVPKQYDDGAGNATIGYGHMVLEGENYSAGLTEAEAIELFKKDVERVVNPAMRRDLTNDLNAAEHALQQAEDSVDAALGPELAIRLHPLKEAFVAYRKQQCDRLKAVFKEGTFGPVAELECLIHLTDSRREFIEERYEFVEKIGARDAKSGVRNPNPGHERLRKALR